MSIIDNQRVYMISVKSILEVLETESPITTLKQKKLSSYFANGSITGIAFILFHFFSNSFTEVIVDTQNIAHI